jgi:hypothetical protein
MDTFLNVIGLFFLLSGIVAWGAGILLTWYYWLCQSKKGD